jgi:hypothetical protein
MQTMIFKQGLCRRTGLVFFFSVLSINIMQSQTQIDYTPPTLGIGARAAALADAYISEAYDVSSMYWNPAALVFLEKSFIVMNHFQEREHNAMIESIAIPLLRSSNALAIGASVAHLGYWKDSPQGAEFRFIQYGLDIAYARTIVPQLSLGACIGMRYGNPKTSHLNVASSSFGLVYSPSPGISYGVAYNGVGERIRYSFDSTATNLHRENQLRSLQVGASMRFPHSQLKPSVFTLTAASEKNLEKHELGYKGGLEICPIRFLALRIGYQVDPSRAAAKYGAGLRLEWLQLDYAIAPSREYDRFQQLSVSIAFWNL